jgi:polygalacturonase
MFNCLKIGLLGIVLITLTAAKAPQNYPIKDFGAIADSVTLNTRAIQTAIDKAAKDGGGIIVIPKGTFLTGALFFKKKCLRMVK